VINTSASNMHKPFSFRFMLLPGDDSLAMKARDRTLSYWLSALSRLGALRHCIDHDEGSRNKRGIDRPFEW